VVSKGAKRARWSAWPTLFLVLQVFHRLPCCCKLGCRLLQGEKALHQVLGLRLQLLPQIIELLCAQAVQWYPLCFAGHGVLIRGVMVGLVV
jgi:hypothetical protein